MKQESLLKKMFYALSSNFVSLFVSILMTLLVPMYFGSDTEKYGYFQLYLFYTGYVGFFHFGWVDGILLREGGKKYENLDKPMYSVQYGLFCWFEFFVAVVLAIIVAFYTDGEKALLLNLSIINIIILLPRSFLQYVLQATDRIKEYSVIISLCRVLYLLLSIIAMLVGVKTYYFFIIADIISKCITLLVAIIYCRDIVLQRVCFSKIQVAFQEIKANFSAGVNLVFANVAAMMITGIVRLCVEDKWNVSTFGQVSLTLNVSSMLITFVSAMAIALFPALRKTDVNILPSLYSKLKEYLMIPAMSMLVFYYPCKLILNFFLPHYEQGLLFMALLFPMLIFEAKMSFLIKTYLQVLRCERFLMTINIITVGVSAMMSFVSVYVFESLFFAVLTILLNMMFRSIVSEMFLSRKIGVKVGKDIFFEIVIVALFVVSNWFVGNWYGSLMYFIGFVIYCIIKKDSIKMIKNDVAIKLNKYKTERNL